MPVETIVEQIASQIIGWGVGTFLAAIVAACGVGGFIWRKINANQIQNQRMDDLLKLIKNNEEMLRIMSCHQLEIACERALVKGCISLHDFQELQKLYDEYEAHGFNGSGKAAFMKVKTDVEIREDCD